MEESTTASKESTMAGKKEKKYKGIIAVLVLVIVAFGAYSLGSNNSDGNSGIGNVIVPTGGGGGSPGAAPVVDFKIKDNDHVLGDPNAPVTVIEYSDFECPFCQRLFTSTLPGIKTNYIDTGKVKFVYRHFPLSIHDNAQKSAEGSECAGEQGKFWEYHDLLFENQRFLDINSLKQYAADLNLDTSQFDSCLDSGKYRSRVQSDFSEGSSAGVRGTPATFVNGKLISGAQPFAAFQAAIESEL